MMTNDSLTPAAMVQAWYERLPKPIRSEATLDVPADETALILDLLTEEVEELRTALGEGSIVRTADALADIVYVAYGAALQLGFDLDAVLGEVHRANMSKCNADGRFEFDSDGKVSRGSEYVPPELEAIVTRVPPWAVSEELD